LISSVTMLSSMLKDYQSKQAVQKENLEKRKNETLQSAIALCDKVSDDLNNQVAVAYCNQKKIDAALKIFQKNYNDFQKMCAEWSSMSNKINDLLKQLGDVTNGARTIKANSAETVRCLENAYKELHPTVESKTSTDQ
ncbi:Biogenesis of lysosome-related organelles complex 1 subunit 1, partial [Trichinella pseudospiralis]